MFTADTVWGIDIGSSCIKAIKLKYSDGRFIVLDFDEFEIDAELKAKEGELAVTRDALEEIFSRKDFSKSEVCISISSKHVNSRFISLPSDLKPKEMKKAIAREAQKQIPFPLKEVEWGYYSLPARDGQVQIALFAVRVEHIEEVLGLIDSSKIKVRGVQVPGLALFNFIDRMSEVDGHIIVLDFGEQSSDLLAIHDGGCWMRSLPLSGQHITSLLENKFRITSKEANTLKREMAKSPQKEKLFRVFEPKLKELVTEIKRSINFRKTQVKNLSPTHFMAYGGSSQLPGVREYFAKELGLKSFGFDESTRLDFSSCKNSKKLRNHMGSFGVAIGLGAQALGQARVELSLTPKKFIVNEILKSKRPVAVVANVAFLLMILFSYFSSSNVIGILEKEKLSAQKEVGKLQGAIGQFEAKLNSLKPLELSGDFILSQCRGNDYAPKIYETLLTILGKSGGVYVTQMELKPIEIANFMNDKKSKPPAMIIDYIGKNATLNNQFYSNLIKHPLFKIEGVKVSLPIGKSVSFGVTKKTKVVIPGVDSFADDVNVKKKREELKWLFDGESSVSKKYNWSAEKLTLHVNMAVLLAEKGLN